ncbi:hypothetical protein, partial [Haloferax profundi]|uniref:hypothetical protein n=1 Tax=Haloferax profundi TaxID=1544718 RepID=UPI000ACA0104
QSNANQVKIKVTLNEEYEIEVSGETIIEGEDEGEDTIEDVTFDNPDHPLVGHLRDNDVSIYKFTAPPDYWLTTFEYAALSFETPDREGWDNLNTGDVILFH